MGKFEEYNPGFLFQLCAVYTDYFSKLYYIAIRRYWRNLPLYLGQHHNILLTCFPPSLNGLMPRTEKFAKLRSPISFQTEYNSLAFYIMFRFCR